MDGVMAQVGVEPGDGLVARLGGAVVLLSTAPDGTLDTFSTALLSLLESGSIEAGSTDLAWSVAQLASSHVGSLPAFGVALPVPEGYTVLLHGAVRAVVEPASGRVELSGAQAHTWVDHVVPDGAARISMTLKDTGDVQPDPRYDVRVGSVPGGGFVLTRQRGGAVPAPSSVAEAPVPQAPPAPARDTVDVPAARPTPAVIETPVAETPVAETAAAPPEPAAPAATELLPQLRPPARETVQVAAPTATFVWDDGTRTPLDRNYVFGREPQFDDLVTSGASVPVVVRDPDQLVSRVQAYVSVRDGVVTIRDAGSANGTFIAAPGAASWDALGATAVELPVGWSVRMGRRVVTHAREGAELTGSA